MGSYTGVRGGRTDSGQTGVSVNLGPRFSCCVNIFRSVLSHCNMGIIKVPSSRGIVWITGNLPPKSFSTMGATMISQ